MIHYSGYTQAELLPTAQLMLDYVVRASGVITAAGRASDPLRTSATPDEVEHPNFIKKYAGKKVRSRSIPFSLVFFADLNRSSSSSKHLLSCELGQKRNMALRLQKIRKLVKWKRLLSNQSSKS